MADTLAVPQWRLAWLALCARLPEKGLRALCSALEGDSPALIQGNYTRGSMCGWPGDDTPVKATCPLCYALWQGLALESVGEVEEAFWALMRGWEPALHTLLVGWIDDTPRGVMRRELLAATREALGEGGA